MQSHPCMVGSAVVVHLRPRNDFGRVEGPELRSAFRQELDDRRVRAVLVTADGFAVGCDRSRGTGGDDRPVRVVRDLAEGHCDLAAGESVREASVVGERWVLVGEHGGSVSERVGVVKSKGKVRCAVAPLPVVYSGPESQSSEPSSQS